MPRVFKRLDRTIFKYIKFIRGKLKPRDELFRDDFEFKGWHFFLIFNRNRGEQPVFNISIHPVTTNASSLVDVPASYGVEFRWYSSYVKLHGVRSIDLLYMDEPPAIRMFYKSEYKVEYNQLHWLVKIMKKQLHFSLDDFDVLSSKFTELMIKMT